ncbi:MAG TPA: molecular chaperone HtpG [Clostridia bacterium]|nr:molecular chaperone HtpG [Clostridia bacterium]
MREGKIQIDSENFMPIIKKWLYSDKDIFLRELVANGCDAIKKYEKLIMMGEAEKDETRPRIRIFVDRENRTIRIEDNGLGMTGEEVEKYITQVALSGAQDFVDRYKDKAGADSGIIGHFGLGFYSAFMVSESVEIQTLSYQKNAEPVYWVSGGDQEYQIGEGSRTARGTTVTLHVAQDESEFLEESRIREILRKYCAFMPYEIFFNPGDDDKDAPVNNPSPLWLKAPKDCTKEEYEKFYSELFMDFNPPLFWIHLNIDYPFNLKGILYFPKQNDKLQVMPGEIKLYSNQVYIADNIKEVVPEFLMLLKGVIDCPDLPLNVSRSFLQNDGDVQKISRHISKKVSDKLHEIFNDQREQFNNYWEDIAPFIKFGCIKDEGFYDRVKDILLLRTINDEYLTLQEYPKDQDGRIFYVSDPDMQSQYVRMFRQQGMNAVLLTHMIDSHFISFIEYKEKDFKFARIDSEISSAMKSEEKTEDEQKIAEKFKNSIGKSDLTVSVERLKDAETPAVMLLNEYSRRMQDFSKAYGETFKGANPETTVVLNLENEIVQAIPNLTGEKAETVCRQIYDLAQLSHKSLSAEEMAGFISRSVKLLGELAKPEQENG